jgi:signal transduction histidine kinase
MVNSLRARVLIWYTALLAGVILAFGAAVCLLSWRAGVTDVDTDLRGRARALAIAVVPAGDGTFDLALPPGPADAGAAGPPRYHVVWTPDGHVIDRSDDAVDVARPSVPGERTRGGAREVSVRSSSGALVLVGAPLDHVRAEVWQLAARLAAGGLAAVGLAFAGGWWLVGRALQPIARISQTARAMTGGDFDARIPQSQVASELGQLAHSLNEAFDRLHAALERQRRFTADASHELRTPLAAMSTELQWALSRDREPAELVESLEVCRRGVDRMATIVTRLLTLARVEADADGPLTEAVHVDAVADRVARDVRPLAADRGVEIRLTRVPAVVTGDSDRLAEALTNVVVNAVQYNRAGGDVDIRVGRDDGDVAIDVRDTGIGIPAGDCARVFEPFYRADAARSRDAGGAGLGLAVARAIVERHGGHISCASEPGAGTVISIRLPAST